MGIMVDRDFSKWQLKKSQSERKSLEKPVHGRRIFVAKHSFNKTVWQCLTLISQFGIMMLVPTGMMFALGYWLDGRLGTQFFAIVLFFVGVLAGFGNIYRLARQIYQKKDKKDRE